MNTEEDQVKRGLAGLFDQVASTYDRVGPRFFSYFGHRLVQLARIPRGAHVLDIATGRGAVLLSAAEQVGQHGYVAGVDLSAGMIWKTATDIKASTAGNAKVYQMDAERLAFQDRSFDFALCGLSMFFFPQPDCAASEMYRILKPGGQIGVTTFAKDSEHFSWIIELLHAYQPPQDIQPSKKQKPILDTSAGLETVLRNAGFENIQVIREEAVFVYEDEEDLWASLWSHGARQILERMESSTLHRFKIDTFEKAQSFKQQDGIRPPPLRVLVALSSK